MANLKLSLGMIPSTSKIEQAEIDLIKEFEKLQAFLDSEELARFNELEALVSSADFIKQKKDIESLSFSHSEEYNREKEFNTLKKSKDIPRYFKTRDGADLRKFREMEGSEKITRYEELMALVSTAEFKAKQKMKPVTFKSTDEYRQLVEYKKLKSSADVKKYLALVNKGKKDEADTLAGAPAISKYLELDAVVKSKEFIEKQNMKPVTFKDTEEYKLLQEFNTLKNNPDIKFYYKFSKSSELANFKQVDGSQKLARYEELKEYLSTEEFKKRKEYLLDKKRFEKSDLFTQEQEYLKLKKSDDIVWYFKAKDSDKFNILKERKLTFSDEFEGEALDTKKWLTNHYWGDKLLHDRYSLETDLHCNTEKENFEVRSGHLKIITKPQKTEGKVWNPALGGFRTKEFDFTSGVINTGKSFRQKYGLFTAKIKLSTGSGPRHAFWMLGEKITPHIDICRTDKGKVWMDYFNDGVKGLKSSLGSRYSKDFYIFSLEWTPEMLVWKINGIEVCRQTSGLPQEEMYLIFSGGLDKPMQGSSAMEIDWVRVYQWNKN